MHPVLVRIGPFTIYSYGVMVALGFGTATFFAYRSAPRLGIDRNKVLDLAILLLISGIVGARLLYILINLGHYLRNPIGILNLSEGGLVWYGGLISSVVSAALFVRRNKLNFWIVADLFAPYIALGQAVGRIGCFLNGCCYGIGHHHTQLYASFALAAIFVVLKIRQNRLHFKGEIFLSYIILYSIKRFAIEFLRGDNPRIFSNLTISQLISVPLLLISLIIFIYRSKGNAGKSL